MQQGKYVPYAVGFLKTLFFTLLCGKMFQTLPSFYPIFEFTLMQGE
jgi:hypothetical protein